MKNWNWILLLLLSSLCFAQDKEVFLSKQAEEDAMVAICAVTLSLTGDEANATWFSTIIPESEALDFFTTLFTLGLKTGEVSIEDLREAAAACLDVKSKFDGSF